MADDAVATGPLTASDLERLIVTRVAACDAELERLRRERGAISAQIRAVVKMRDDVARMIPRKRKAD